MNIERSRTLLCAASVATALFLVVGNEPRVDAQKTTAADTASAFSGVWKVNHELSPGIAPAGGGGGGRIGRIAPDIAMAVMPRQRGGPGAGGGGVDMSDGALASQKFVQSMHGVPEQVTIRATADSVTFVDPRGERTYPVTGKDVKLTIDGAALTTNAKWDKDSLKQQIISGEQSMKLTWELASSKTRLNYKITLLNLGSDTARPTEIKAVYDKAQ